LAHTNERLRELYLNRLGYEIPLTLELSSSNYPFSFEGFEALRAWEHDSPFLGWSDETSEAPWLWCITQVHLFFDVTEPVALEDLRMEASSFVKATMDFRGTGEAVYTEVQLAIRTMDTSATWKKIACTDLMLRDVRSEARRALVWATDRPSGGYRPQMAKLYFLGFKEDAEVLKLYMDGRGRVTGLKSSVTSAVVEVPNPEIFDTPKMDDWHDDIEELDVFKHYTKWYTKNARLDSRGWSSLRLIERLTNRLNQGRRRYDCE
jgi:hypothetical protein